jgi:hypothetical protein
MRWAYQSKTEKSKQALIDLARTWTQAAVQSERTSVVIGSPPEVRLHKGCLRLAALFRR